MPNRQNTTVHKDVSACRIRIYNVIWEISDDIENDPGETTNAMDKYSEVVAKMRKAYDQWWDVVLPAMVNEDVPYAKDNPFRVLYLRQNAEQGIPAWPADEP